MNKEKETRIGKVGLAKDLAQRLNLSYDVSVSIIETFMESLVHGIDNYDKVDLCGLLTLSKSYREPRDIQLKGEIVHVEGGTYIKATMHTDFNRLEDGDSYSDEQRDKILNKYKRN